jgi:hypothetical protein
MVVDRANVEKGPRMRWFAGRPDSFIPNLPNLMPSIDSDVNTLVDLFNKKTINPEALTALIGAHSTANQFHAFPAQSKYILGPIFKNMH